MSFIYVLRINKVGNTEKYGLFFDDEMGRRCSLKENWKNVVFDTEEQALEKLRSIEEERRREDSAEIFTSEEAMVFVERQRWKYATTYAETAPHEYLVKVWLSEEDKLGYERFVSTMKKNSVVGFFYGHKNDYFILGDYYYWFMGQHENMAVDLINRTTINYLEYKNGTYYYKRKLN